MLLLGTPLFRVNKPNLLTLSKIEPIFLNYHRKGTFCIFSGWSKNLEKCQLFALALSAQLSGLPNEKPNTWLIIVTLLDLTQSLCLSSV